MRGTVAKKLRRYAQENAEPVRKRQGWIVPPQAPRRKSVYMLVCLGVRRMYLDLKKAYKRGEAVV
jgi:hypothetical protein